MPNDRFEVLEEETMRIVAKPISAIVIYEYDGTPRPYKFKYKNSKNEDIRIVVDEIVFQEPRRIAGIESIVYRCKSYVDKAAFMYELKFIPRQCKWVLYRM